MTFHMDNLQTWRPARGIAGFVRSTHSARRSGLNVWLLFICLAGLVIVWADGLSRPSAIESQESAIEPLTYEPYHGAFVFASVMLPLVFCYAAVQNVSRKEALLLWFVLCTTAYAKDFSYISVPGSKIFITDIVLMLLMMCLVRQRSKLVELGRWPLLAFAGFVVAGLTGAVRGLVAGQDKMLVLRDSAIFVYAFFLPVGFVLASSWEAVERVLLFFLLGAGFSSMNALAWFFVQPGQRRYLDYGPYVLISFLLTVILTTNRILPPLTGWLLSALFGIGVALAGARTVEVILLLLAIAMVFVGPSGRFRLGVRNLRFLLWLGLFLTCVLVVLSSTKFGANFLQSAGEDLVSGTVNYSEDDNANFRLLAWLEALHRFSEQPMTGEGFGIPFTFELSDLDPRPHNTYLTVLYKMGLIGLAPLLALLFWLHWQGWKTLRSLKREREALFLYALLVAQLAMAAFGLLNLLLESPFLACIYWLILGMGIRLLQWTRCDHQSSLLPEFAH
jgi:O-antigen ligase